MEAAESPLASSESGTTGLSPADFARHRKRKFSTATSTDRSTREYGLMRESGRHDTSRFVGSSTGIHFIRNVYVRLARKSALGSDSGPRAGNDLVPGEDDQLLRSSSSRDGSENQLWKAHELAVDPEAGTAQPTFDQLVRWSKSYFEAWHPTLPFLHAPDILSLFETISNDGIAGVSHLEASIVRSILSISLADSRQSTPLDTPIPSFLVFGTVEEAMLASQHALYRPASIQSTQAALSVQLFLISMLRLNSASRLGGLIVRMAFHLGLHRCPSRFPFFSRPESQMRRRIFWCIYSLERFLCQSLGLPLDIRDDDVDVCFPGQEHHGPPEDDDNRLALLGYLAKHARIRGLILELRNKSISSRHDTAEQASHVQAELAKWSNEIHDLVDGDFDVDDGQQPHVISPNHRIYLLLLKHESAISLNRPMMTSDPLSPSYAAALQECIFAAKSLLGILRRHHTRYKIPDGHCLTQPMLWPSFTWAVWISSFILVYAAFEGQLPLAVALRNVQSGKEILHHIAARDTSWPEYCLSAIDELTAAIQDTSLLNDTTPKHTGPGGPRLASLRARQGTASAGTPLNGSEPPGFVSQEATREGSGRYSQNMISPSGGMIVPRALNNPDSRPAKTRRSSRISQHLGAQDTGSSYTTREGLSTGQLNNRPIYPMAHRAEFNEPGATPAEHQQLHLDTDAASFSLNQPFSRALAATSFPSMPPTTSSFPASDAEGQESMIWFDQLFANAFGSIDYPVLAAAQFDPSIDPIWS